MVVKALRTHILCSHFYSCRGLYIGLAVSRVVCRALQLYSSRYASTALQLYSALHSTTSAPTLCAERSHFAHASMRRVDEQHGLCEHRLGRRKELTPPRGPRARGRIRQAQMIVEAARVRNQWKARLVAPAIVAQLEACAVASQQPQW